MLSTLQKIIQKFRHGLVLQVIRGRLLRLSIDVSPYDWICEESPEHLSAEVDGNFSDYTFERFGPGDINLIGSRPTHMNISVEELHKRLDEGMRCYGVKCKGEVAAFTWLNLKECDNRFNLVAMKPNEAYLFDLYTMKSHRGKNLAAYVRKKTYAVLNKEGKDTFYSTHVTLNKSSARAKEKLGAVTLKRGLYIRLFKKMQWNLTLWELNGPNRLHKIVKAALLILLVALGLQLILYFRPLDLDYSYPAHDAAMMKTASTVTFLGDTSFGENYQEDRAKWTENILLTKGYDHSLKKFAALLKNSDLVVANLETPVTSLRVSPYAKTKEYIHYSDTALTPGALSKHNIRVVSLANNHTLDFGLPGLKETMDSLKQNGIEWFAAGLNETGAAQPYIKSFDVVGRIVRVALIGAFEYRVSYDQKYDFYAHQNKGGAQSLSVGRISEQIKDLKRDYPDIFVIVFPHWGENYKWKTEEQTLLGRQLINVGADLIIGHGAHMLQEVEFFRDRYIVYSIGNFVFNSDGRYQKFGVEPYSLIAQLILEYKKEGVAQKLRLYPILTDNLKTDFQGRFLKRGEFRKAHQLLKQKSPDPDAFKERVKTGRDKTGYFMQFELK